MLPGGVGERRYIYADERRKKKQNLVASGEAQRPS